MGSRSRTVWLAALASLVAVLVLPGVASAFTVNVTGNDDDTACGVAPPANDCTFPEAVNAPNANPDASTIDFDIGSGAQVIALGGGQVLTGPTTIDGTTQTGWNGSQPLIEIDGTFAGSSAGLQIQGSPSTIKGIAINDFLTSQIFLDNADGTTITGTNVGTNAAGTLSNSNDDTSVGIVISNGTENTVIGSGTGTATRNVISGIGTGLSVSSTGHDFVNNYIGPNAAGTGPVPLADTGDDLELGSAGNALIEDNLISGNGGNGINFLDGTGEVARGNLIGTNAAGTADLGNGANGISAGSGTTFTGNTIGGTTAADRNVISGGAGRISSTPLPTRTRSGASTSGSGPTG